VTSAEFRQRLTARAARAGLNVSPHIAEQLEAYFRALAKWNAKINLTALPLDPPSDDTFDRLLVEPLVAAGHVDDAWTPWVDLGSGSGSPAIPVKIAKPSLRLTMVESRGRKAAFLREAIRSLGLSASAVENARFEQLAARVAFRSTAAVVTVRGVRVDDELFRIAAQLLHTDGRLALFESNTEPTRGESPQGFMRDATFPLVESGPAGTRLSIYRRVFNTNGLD